MRLGSVELVQPSGGRRQQLFLRPLSRRPLPGRIPGPDGRPQRPAPEPAHLERRPEPNGSFPPRRSNPAGQTARRPAGPAEPRAAKSRSIRIADNRTAGPAVQLEPKPECIDDGPFRPNLWRHVGPEWPLTFRGTSLRFRFTDLVRRPEPEPVHGESDPDLSLERKPDGHDSTLENPALGRFNIHRSTAAPDR